jgi:hypothetical protein
MLSAFAGNLVFPRQRPIYARGVYAEMTRDLCAGQAKLTPTSSRDGHSGITRFATPVSPLYFLSTDLVSFAFLPDNVGDRAAATPQFQLSYLLFLGFLENGRDESAASEDSFVVFGLLSFSLR